jgi:inosine-uridine nucleoside N-ribohydrolase
MTDLALAISIVPHFAVLAQGLVFMGGSISPHTGDAEFVNNPRHEVNFWLDPERRTLFCARRRRRLFVRDRTNSAEGKVT